VPAAGVRVPRPHGSGAAEERPTSLRGEGCPLARPAPLRFAFRLGSVRAARRTCRRPASACRARTGRARPRSGRHRCGARGVYSLAPLRFASLSGPGSVPRARAGGRRAADIAAGRGQPRRWSLEWV